MTTKPILQTVCAEEEPPASPTKRELFELLLQSGGATQCVSIEWIESFANAVLARWGHQPTPPADGEVAELVEWLREQLHVCLQAPWTPGIKHFGRAAELLERLSPPQPVPVSERPPGPKDCDAIGCCWWYSASHGWELYHRENGLGTSTHWLPAHALPLPEVGE